MKKKILITIKVVSVLWLVFFVTVFSIGGTALSLLIAPKSVSAALDSSQNEYTIDVGPVTGNTGANYVYVSFFNPSGSGKYLQVGRMRAHNTASTTAVYNEIDVRRITSASGGTQISAANIPAKHASSTASIAEIRKAGVTVAFAGSTDSSLMSVVGPGTTGSGISDREVYFGDGDERLLLAPGEGIAYYQTTAGDADQRMNFLISWRELAADPGAQNEYMISYPRVERAAAAGEKYFTFFNPVGSGKNAIIKRVRVDIDADAAAIYSTNFYLARITAASGGTQTTAANVPKKHSSSANTVMELRRTTVTATLAGTADASILRMVPPGATTQNTSHQELYFDNNEERLVLQPGEGIALINTQLADVDHLTRLSVEWDEESSAPSSQGEYIVATPLAKGVAWAANDSVATFFNPGASGKYAVIKRIGFRVMASTTATYVAASVRPITAASGANALAASDIYKKNTGSSNSAMEIRWASAAGGVTETFASTTDTRLLGAQTPGLVGQTFPIRERVFGSSEDLVIPPGMGVSLYVEGTADVDQSFTLLIDWGEQASPPTAQNEYMMSIGPINGSTTSGYKYVTFFNPAGSGKYININRMAMNVVAVAAAVYVPITIQRISAASAGTAISATNIPKKNQASPQSVADVRTTNVTATFTGTSAARILSGTTPGAASSATAQQLTAIKDQEFSSTENILLGPGEGIVLYQEAAGDADFRVRLSVDWSESSTLPHEEGDNIISTGPITGVATDQYVYSSFFNPAGSGKTFIIRRLGIDATRTGTLAGTVPTVLVRKISAASGGTSLTASDFPQKHSSSTASVAEIRNSNASVTFQGSSDSALLRAIAPVLVGDMDGVFDVAFRTRSEVILKPGEGVALYQDTGAKTIDTNMRYRLEITWSELDTDQSTYRFFDNADSASPDTALAASSTAATLTSDGQAFRLRQIIGFNGSKISTSTENMKLQFAVKSGTCDTAFSGESYSDVTTSSDIAFNDNASVADGADALSTSTDPKNGERTITWQTYDESNNFTNSSSTDMTEDSDGLWDFALYDKTAPDSTTYCFRVVRADDTPMDTYTFIPEISTSGSSMTFTTDTDNFTSINPGTPVFATTTLRVNSSNSTGWNVTLSGDNKTTSQNNLLSGGNSITDQTEWISPTATTSAGNAVRISSFANSGNVLAFRVMTASGTAAFRADTWWGTTDNYTDIATTLWAGIASSTVSRKIGNTSVTSGGDALNSVIYYLNTSSTQPAGSYSGDITVIATANP